MSYDLYKVRDCIGKLNLQTRFHSNPDPLKLIYGWVKQGDISFGEFSDLIGYANSKGMIGEYRYNNRAE